MTATSRASEVWLLLVDPQLEPDPYRAVDMLMEMDGVEREEAVRRLHEAAAEWVESHRKDGLNGSILKYHIQFCDLKAAEKETECNLATHYGHWTYDFYRKYGAEAVRILRLIQSLPQ